MLLDADHHEDADQIDDCGQYARYDARDQDTADRFVR